MWKKFASLTLEMPFNEPTRLRQYWWMAKVKPWITYFPHTESPKMFIVIYVSDSLDFSYFIYFIVWTNRKEKSPVPFLINCCVREVEKRGINEVGIYRLSGSTSDVQRLRRVFENDPFEAEQLLREVDINAVAHLLKLYLRELPEALFTDQLYPDLFEALSQPEPEEKSARLLALFQRLPAINRNIVMHLIDHMVVINRHEEHNKVKMYFIDITSSLSLKSWFSLILIKFMAKMSSYC